jgi:hypothetical protein
MEMNYRTKVMQQKMEQQCGQNPEEMNKQKSTFE